MSDNYLELLEDAQGALRALLMGSEPGTGMTLHHAYRDLKETITRVRDGAPPEVDARTAEAARRQTAWEQRLARDFIKQTTPREREHLVLGIFAAGDRLTGTEVLDRLREATPQYDIYQSPVTGAVDRLRASGDLDREPEPFRGKVRYRYFRRTTLEGPIADLQRAFDEEPPR